MPSIDLRDRPSEEDIDSIVTAMSEDEQTAINEEEADQLKEKMKEESAELDVALSLLGSKLEEEFGEFSRKRYRKEMEWIDAIEQYRGSPSQEYSKEAYEQGVRKVSKDPKINLTAHKVNMAIARMIDLQLPLGGDFNFSIDPAPDPDLEQYIGDETPMQEDPNLTKDAVAKAGLVEAMDRAKRMQLRIQNQMVAGDWGRLTRESMRDWCLLGTGVTKGPVTRPVRKKKYNNVPDSEGGVWSDLVTEVDYEPTPQRVDIRYFYPDPECLVPEELDRAFEVRPTTRSELIKMADDPSFMRERIRRVLQKTPDMANEGRIFNLNGIIDSNYSIKNKYIVKVYNGPLDKEVLKYIDVDMEEDLEDEFTQVFGEVYFVAGEVIRVSVSPLDGDDCLPYQIVVWEKDDTSLFGHGMAYKMRDQQKVANAAWKMLLDNAGLSAGPQLALNKEMIEPANGVWDIEPFKIWFLTEYGTRVEDAIQFVNVPNNQENLSRVIEMAMQFADIESETPMISQNLLPQANNASGMGLVLTEANVSQRELSMAWDKYIIVPLIRRFVDYNMQYSPDPEIKGNFEVHVGAATQRIDNQIIAQDIERILAMAGQNPRYQVQIDEEAAFRKWASASRVGPEILRGTEEVRAEIQRMEEEAANQPPDPETLRAQAVMMREEARQQEYAAEMEHTQMKYQSEMEQRQFEQQKAITEFEEREKDRELQLLMKQADRELTLLKMAESRQTTLAQIQKDLQIAQMHDETSTRNKAIDFEKFREQIRVKREFGTGVSQT